MSQHLLSASNKGREISREGMSLCVRYVLGDASADLIAVVGSGGQQCLSRHLSSATNKGKRSLPVWMSLCLRYVPGDASADPTTVVRGGNRNSAQTETFCAWGSFVSPTESAYLCSSALPHLARNCILVSFCFFVVL